MTKRFSVLSAATLFLAFVSMMATGLSCTPGSNSQNAGAGIANGDDLVGSWHAAPAVGSGYSDRYIFRADGTFVFLYNQYDENKTLFELDGTWKRAGDGIDLHISSQITADGILEPADRDQHVALGEMIELSSDESYPFKRTFTDVDFWKYSDDFEMWSAELSDIETAVANGGWAANESGEGEDKYRISPATAVEAVMAVVGETGPGEVIGYEGDTEIDARSFYIVHYYQIVDDGKDTAHNATRDWYYVDVNDGTVYLYNVVTDDIETVARGEE